MVFNIFLLFLFGTINREHMRASQMHLVVKRQNQFQKGKKIIKQPLFELNVSALFHAICSLSSSAWRSLHIGLALFWNFIPWKILKNPNKYYWRNIWAYVWYSIVSLVYDSLAWLWSLLSDSLACHCIMFVVCFWCQPFVCTLALLWLILYWRWAVVGLKAAHVSACVVYFFIYLPYLGEFPTANIRH